MTDDTIIKSARAIAKARRTTVSAINEAIDCWADQAITDKARKHGLALELARLDELEEVFYQRALEGDVKGAAPADGTFRCPSAPVAASASLGREQTGNRFGIREIRPLTVRTLSPGPSSSCNCNVTTVGVGDQPIESMRDASHIPKLRMH
jgi:hypothetical protein